MTEMKTGLVEGSRRAIIVGASSGIGASLARSLAAGVDIHWLCSPAVLTCWRLCALKLIPRPGKSARFPILTM